MNGIHLVEELHKRDAAVGSPVLRPGQRVVVVGGLLTGASGRVLSVEPAGAVRLELDGTCQGVWLQISAKLVAPVEE